MPRKQRFKPSRKPKPNPPNADSLIGQKASHAESTHENDYARAGYERDEDPPPESELDPRSR